ncbi:hypothetical protein P691DRAFT_760934 [Macrolepiota fuliginosa MF-IS2]|uniref:Uncharacterized protein n=1 Tax=Macrolepiota fuliginosa MF-IS2 TaxID=1400762 RepID=A0A9P5XC06_9AGAR|nr:hypothetical protein P691DRAFT_760934 [Macrolepiota fuliginosa MF-IS2]
MASQDPTTTSRPRRPEPELEIVPLAKMTRKTVERLAPFCQMRLPPELPNVPLVPKTNSKILGFIQAVDTSMLVAQIGYRLASDAASLCDPFAPPSVPTHGNKHNSALSTPEMLQTMAAHGHGHCLKTSDAFSNIQQEIFKIAAVTKDKDIVVLVPPDPQQPATRRITLKEIGTDLVANLNLLNQFSRSMVDLTSWWEWLEEELMSPDSVLLPTTNQRDAELFARWSKIKGGYLDYYNTIRVVYARYPQLLTTSSTAWQSISSVPPPPSSPGSSWDGSYQDLGDAFEEAIAEEARNASHDQLRAAPDDEKAGWKEKAKSIKSIKSIKSVKAFVGRIKVIKVFGRKKAEKGGDNKEKEGEEGKKTKKVKEKKSKKDEKGKAKVEVEGAKVEETPVIDVSQTSEQEQSQAPPKALVPEEPPKNNEEAPKVEPEGGQVPKKEGVPVETAPEATADQDRHSRNNSHSGSSTSSAKSKKGVAKVLAALKELFAKLGCQGGAEVEN